MSTSQVGRGVEAGVTVWSIVVATWISLFVFGLLDNIRGPFFSELITSFAVSDSMGALFFASTSLSAFVGSWMADDVLRRFGIFRTLKGGLVSMGLGFGAMTVADNFLQLMLPCVLFGLSLGLAGVAQNMAVATYSAPKVRRQLLSALHALYGLASLSAPLLARVLMLNEWSWRGSFLLAAASPLALWLGIFSLAEPADSPSAGVARPASEPRSDVGLRVWLMSGVGAFYLVAEILMGTRLVRFLELTQGSSATDASLYLSGFFFLLFVGRGLFMVHHWSFLKTEAVLMGASLLGASLQLLGLMVSPWFLVLSGLVMGPFYPLMMEYIQNQFGEYSALAVSRVMAWGSIAVVGLHLLVGQITDRFSIRAAMLIGPIGLMTCCLFLFLNLPARRR